MESEFLVHLCTFMPPIVGKHEVVSSSKCFFSFFRGGTWYIRELPRPADFVVLSSSCDVRAMASFARGSFAEGNDCTCHAKFPLLGSNRCFGAMAKERCFWVYISLIHDPKFKRSKCNNVYKCLGGCRATEGWLSHCFHHSRLRNSFLIWVRIWRLYQAATSPEDVVGTGVPDDYSDPQPRSMAKIYFTLRGEITPSLPLALLENLDKAGWCGAPASLTQRLGGFLRFGRGDAWRGGRRRVGF